MRQMYPYLMGPAGFEPAADMSESIESAQDLVMRHSGTRILFGHGLAFPVCRMASDRRVYCAGIVFQNTMGNGFVLSRKRPGGKLTRER